MNKSLENANPHVIEVLKKQFEIGGYTEDEFNNTNFTDKETKNPWWSNLSWTREQESKYGDWFVDYLRNSSSARRAIMAIPSTKKENIRKVWSWWNFQFGFKVIEEG